MLSPVRELPRSRVEVRDGRIAAVEEWPGAAPVGAIDAETGWIAPGLIDAQVNGAFGQDFSDPAADVARAAWGMLAHGVTAFVPTLVTLPWERYPAALASLGRAPGAGEPGQPRAWGRGAGAEPLGVHLEGPFLSPRYHGAHPPAHLRLPALADVEHLLALGPVRMLTLAPELSGAIEALRRLARVGVVVALGHSAATFDQARRALLNGARAGTHLFNAMPPLHHREPGLAGALLAAADAIVGVIADGIHVHPAMLQVAARARGAGGLMLVTDAIAAMGMPPGEYTLGEQRVRTSRREARLEDGTLAGSVLTLDGAVRTMVSLAAVPLVEAVTMATLTPARLLGVAHERGRVAPGYRADLVVLGPDLRVRCTVQGGRVVYKSEGTG